MIWIIPLQRICSWRMSQESREASIYDFVVKVRWVMNLSSQGLVYVYLKFGIFRGFDSLTVLCLMVMRDWNSVIQLMMTFFLGFDAIWILGCVLLEHPRPYILESLKEHIFWKNFLQIDCSGFENFLLENACVRMLIVWTNYCYVLPCCASVWCQYQINID